MDEIRRHTQQLQLCPGGMPFGLLVLVLIVTLSSPAQAFQPTGFRVTPTRTRETTREAGWYPSAKLVSTHSSVPWCVSSCLRLSSSSSSNNQEKNNNKKGDEENVRLEKSSSSDSIQDKNGETSETSTPDDLPINGEEKSTMTVASSSPTTSDESNNVTFWKRIKSYFRGSKEDDGLTFRQRLGKAGLSMVLSYGWVSNMSYCVTVSAAWYIFSKQTKLSPLAPGQWKKFLAVYAGFYVFNNIIRPIRFAAAAIVSPQFDRLVDQVQTRLNISKRVSIALTVVAVNLFGTTALMCAMIAGAAALSGVPVFPPKMIP